MPNKTITERQQYRLDHLKAAEAANSSLVDYAKANDLKVKDLYQWKTTLINRGFLSSPQSAFVAVKAKSSSAVCSVALPNGVRLEFQGALPADLLKELVSSASQLIESLQKAFFRPMGMTDTMRCVTVMVLSN